MNASTRRTALAAVTTLAFVGAVFFGGGYAVGLLSDQERADASIRAASDFGSPPADDVVSFAGCGQLRLDLPEDASFSLTVTLYDAAAGDQYAVTVTEADAGSPASGFWYHSGQDRYRFVAQKTGSSGGGKILAAELDGERYENDRGCAKVGGDGTTTTAGNDGTSNVETDGTTTAGNDGTITTVGNDAATTVGSSTAGDAGDGKESSSDDGTTPSETKTAADTARTSTTTGGTTAEATTAETTAAEVTTAEATTAEPTNQPETKTTDDGSSQS